MANPAWFGGLEHNDWLFDGRTINDTDTLLQFNGLDWDKAWMDMGPSPLGNLGPYWHVPSADAVHRLHPRVPGKWLGVIRRAVEEAVAKAVPKQADLIERQRGAMQVLLDEVKRLQTVLNEVHTNGEWTDGEQSGDWKISAEVYAMIGDALENNAAQPDAPSRGE